MASGSLWHNPRCSHQLSRVPLVLWLSIAAAVCLLLPQQPIKTYLAVSLTPRGPWKTPSFHYVRSGKSKLLNGTEGPSVTGSLPICPGSGPRTHTHPLILPNHITSSGLVFTSSLTSLLLHLLSCLPITTHHIHTIRLLSKLLSFSLNIQL